MTLNRNQSRMMAVIGAMGLMSQQMPPPPPMSDKDGFRIAFRHNTESEYGKGTCARDECKKVFYRRAAAHFYCSPDCKDKAAAQRRADRESWGYRPAKKAKK